VACFISNKHVSIGKIPKLEASTSQGFGIVNGAGRWWDESLVAIAKFYWYSLVRDCQKRRQDSSILDPFQTSPYRLFAERKALKNCRQREIELESILMEVREHVDITEEYEVVIVNDSCYSIYFKAFNIVLPVFFSSLVESFARFKNKKKRISFLLFFHEQIFFFLFPIQKI
jgi:hypothetical protein